MIEEEGQRHHVLIKDFNTFIYDHTLHRIRKHFCRYYCLQAFSREETLKLEIKDCIENNGKQRIKMHKKGERVKFRNFKQKTKSPFVIYKDFGSILVPEDNGKQNPDKSYTNKY